MTKLIIKKLTVKTIPEKTETKFIFCPINTGTTIDAKITSPKFAKNSENLSN